MAMVWSLQPAPPTHSTSPFVALSRPVKLPFEKPAKLNVMASPARMFIAGLKVTPTSIHDLSSGSRTSTRVPVK
jgi:hypothetical protein